MADQENVEEKKDEILQKMQKTYNEQEKWAQDADIEAGKMHNMLDIPQDEDVMDHYNDPEQLARDLLDATGDKGEASGMLGFVANVSDDTETSNFYDDARSALSDMEE